MTDLMAFGGPAGPCYAQKVIWERPTNVISVSAGTARNTSTDQYNVYQQLASRDGYGWKAMCERAKIPVEQLGSLGIGGFSAFHGFANAMCKNDADFERLSYVHLADACFDGAGATTSGKPGYVKFATAAAAGADKLMVATTNGPWGKALDYSWTYPEGDTVRFNISSGAQCMELVWKAAVSAGMPVSTPEIPPGVPPPTKAMRVGNLIWCHYESMVSGVAHPCGGEYTPHGWHVTALSTPFMQHYGAPWMAGKRGGLSSLLSGGADKTKIAQGAVVLGLAAVVAYAVWQYLQPGPMWPNGTLGRWFDPDAAWEVDWGVVVRGERVQLGTEWAFEPAQAVAIAQQQALGLGPVPTYVGTPRAVSRVKPVGRRRRGGAPPTRLPPPYGSA